MITIEQIKTQFSHISAWRGNSEVYHDTVVFEGYGTFCDLYFKSIDKEIKQQQVDIYNKFENTHRNYIDEIVRFINSNLNSSERNKSEQITKSPLFFDVIEVPFDNFKYDLVLVCGKTYKSFFLKKDIGIRVEFKSGQIKTIQREKNTTEDND